MVRRINSYSGASFENRKWVSELIFKACGAFQFVRRTTTPHS